MNLANLGIDRTDSGFGVVSVVWANVAIGFPVLSTDRSSSGGATPFMPAPSSSTVSTASRPSPFMKSPSPRDAWPGVFLSEVILTDAERFCKLRAGNTGCYLQTVLAISSSLALDSCDIGLSNQPDRISTDSGRTSTRPDGLHSATSRKPPSFSKIFFVLQQDGLPTCADVSPWR